MFMSWRTGVVRYYEISYVVISKNLTYIECESMKRLVSVI
jgi:hypothetical protein